jgi:hypothetical protein
MERASAWLALLLAASPVQPAVPITYDELRTLPDDALARRLFGGLAPDIVLGNRPQASRAPFGLRVASVWAWTRPRPSDQPGVCATDRSILMLERDFLRGLDRENPALRLARVQTQTYYIVHDRDLAERRTRPDPDRPGAWGGACATLDPRRDGVPAADARQLVRARALLDEFGEAARAGHSRVPIDCAAMHRNGPAPADEAACLGALRYLRADLADWVSECRGVPAAANCIRILAQEVFIEFSLNQGQEPIAIKIEGVEDTSAIQ